MEFNELQKIWDAQTDKPIYAINETALHNRILSKKKKGLRISNISEFLIILVNLAGGSLILGLNVMKNKPGISLYLLSGWMFIVAFYAMTSRIERLRKDKQFDRSMYGDLLHALSVATYQVRFSQLMRWNSLPVAVLIFLSALEAGNMIWVGVGTSVFMLIANYAAGWEHNIYRSRKNELQILKQSLTTESR